MSRFGIFTAWNFLQQNPMRRGVSAMGADHAVDKRLDSASAWQFVVSGSAQYGQYLIKVPLSHRLNECELVWKVLIKGADAYAGCLRHRISREPAPTSLPQNVSRGLEYSLNGRLGTRLLRLLPHHART